MRSKLCENDDIIASRNITYDESERDVMIEYLIIGIVWAVIARLLMRSVKMSDTMLVFSFLGGIVFWPLQITVAAYVLTRKE